MFDRFKRHVRPDGKLLFDGEVEFAKVDPEWWAEADRILPIVLPPVLKEFLIEIGYGVIPKALDGSGHSGSDNAVVAPHQIAREFKKQKKLYKSQSGLGIGLPFFMLDTEDYLVLEVGGRLDGAVTWSDDREKVVSRTIQDFFEAISNNPNFYVGTDNLAAPVI